MSRLAFVPLTLLLFATACGGDNNVPKTPDAPGSPSSTILAAAQGSSDLTTLVAAVQFSSDNDDLVKLLDSPGALTVFAPTNAAFDALAVELTGQASAKGADLLTPVNKPLLRSVLGYHVLTTEVKASAIPFGKAITTSQRDVFKIDTGSPPTIKDGRNRLSKIVMTDIDASNGVVHILDKVLLPPDKNIVQTAQALAGGTPGEFKVLVEAVVAADLAGTLSGAGPFTVFAPTDAAFAALLTELGVTKAQLLGNKPLLTKVLTYHVVAGRVLKADVPVDTSIATVQGGTFKVNAKLAITDGSNRQSKIVAADTFATNGVIHVIDKVILPAQ